MVWLIKPDFDFAFALDSGERMNQALLLKIPMRIVRSIVDDHDLQRRKISPLQEHLHAAKSKAGGHGVFVLVNTNYDVDLACSAQEVARLERAQAHSAIVRLHPIALKIDTDCDSAVYSIVRLGVDLSADAQDSWRVQVTARFGTGAVEDFVCNKNVHGALPVVV